MRHGGIGELIDAALTIGGLGGGLEGAGEGLGGLDALLEDFLLSLRCLTLSFGVVVGIFYQFLVEGLEVAAFEVEDSLDLALLLIVVLAKKDVDKILTGVGIVESYDVVARVGENHGYFLSTLLNHLRSILASGNEGVSLILVEIEETHGLHRLRVLVVDLGGVVVFEQSGIDRLALLHLDGLISLLIERRVFPDGIGGSTFGSVEILG